MYIESGQMLAHVTDQGGSVTYWAHGEHTLMGPVRQVQTVDGLRLRGDSHWCFPQFGSAPKGGPYQHWPKHGFVRQLNMRPQRSGLDIVGYHGELLIAGQFVWSCELVTISGLSERTLKEPDRLEVVLAITNTSGPYVPEMPVLPALHSYLTVEPGYKLWIGNQLVDVSGDVVGPLRIGRVDPIVLERTFGRVIICPSENCEWLVIWSDRPDLYLCVEPVFGGRPGSFNTAEGYTLASLDQMRCSVAFQFEPA